MAANGYTAADVPRLQAGAKVNYAISFVAWFLMALVLALVGPHFGDGILDLLHIGVLLWLGFAASVGVTNNRFSEKPISAWVIDAGYQSGFNRDHGRGPGVVALTSARRESR